MDKKLKSPHVLVIRLSAMGDAAMVVPPLLALLKSRPEVKVTILTKPHLAPIFDGIAGVSVIAAQVKTKHKGVLGLWRLASELRQLQTPITHVADLHNVLRSKILGFFLQLRGLPIVRINKGRSEKKALTRAKHKKFVPLATTIDRYGAVFAQLGFPVTPSPTQLLPKASLSAQLQAVLGDTQAPCIGIAPFAAFKAKMYPLSLMQQAMQLLVDQNACRILLFGGGKEETAQLQALASKFGPQVQSVAGNLNLKEELALMSHLDLMLAMDSGNGHLAANYGVPVLTIWGVTHPYAGFAPYGQPQGNALLPSRVDYPLLPTSVYGNKYPEGYAEVIHTIKPETVAKRVVALLVKQ